MISTVIVIFEFVIVLIRKILIKYKLALNFVVLSLSSKYDHVIFSSMSE